MTIAPPLLGVCLGFAVVMGALFYGAIQDEDRQMEQDERRYQHVPPQDIDTDYAAGGD